MYYPKFVSEAIANEQLEYMWNNLDWYQVENTPRREYWQNVYDVPYTYGSGRGVRTYEARPWDSYCAGLMYSLNRTFDCNMNCCFINGYSDEKDSLGWHADDSPEMNDDQPIISVSLGEEREIFTRNNETKEITKYMLGNGSAFVMPPGFQNTHEHKIPRGGRPMGKRISLTYRNIISEK